MEVPSSDPKKGSVQFSTAMFDMGLNELEKLSGFDVSYMYSKCKYVLIDKFGLLLKIEPTARSASELSH